MHKPIVVVGSLNLDLVARVNRLPALGETVSGLEFQTYCGGKGANQAVALARLGASVSMVGKLGTDVFGAQLLAGLRDAGVDVSCVDCVAGSTGTALIITTTGGDNSIVVIPGANGTLFPADIDRYREQIEEAPMVLAQLEIPIETVEYLGDAVRASGVPLLLDPAPARQLSPNLLRSVTWFTPNESEIRSFLSADIADFNLRSASQIADRLLRLGVRNVILKLGAEGVYLAGQDVERRHIDAFPVHAVDTTAAGDAFNGAFAYALAERKMSPVDAAEFACAVAALSVTRAGAQTSMPTMAESEAFLAQQQASR